MHQSSNQRKKRKTSKNSENTSQEKEKKLEGVTETATHAWIDVETLPSTITGFHLMSFSACK
jgi:hypothetical protein